MKPQDNINYIDKTVKHNEHGFGKVVEKTGNDLKVLFDKAGEVYVHKNTVKIIEDKNDKKQVKIEKSFQKKNNIIHTY